MRQLTNGLLQRLPPVYRRALLASMEEVALPIGSVLYEPGHRPEYAHFVLLGAISVSDCFQSGDGVEVFSVGREGLVEAAHLLGHANSPTRAVVRTDNLVARIRFSELEVQFAEYQPLRAIILAYVQKRVFLLEQLSACNRHHEVEARLARWLLMMQDQMGTEVFPATQEVLAELLGTRRTTVTHAARGLQKAKAIEYSRGNIRIVDRKSLQLRACECYAVVRRFAVENRVSA